MSLYNKDAEQAVLGSVLISPKTMVLLSSILKPDDFYFEAHKIIYSSMLTVHERGEDADIVSLTEEIGEQLENAGGIVYISELSDIPSAANVEQHAKIIKEKSKRRSIFEYAKKLQESVSKSEDVEELMSQAEIGLMDLDVSESDNDFLHISQSVMESVDNITERYNSDGSITGVTTGHVALDEATAGFQPSNLIIIAARPSVGKTALALDIGKNAAKAGKTVGIISLEMRHPELTDRLLASEGMIDGYKIKTGALEEKDWSKLMIASGVLSDLPIYIEDGEATTVPEIRTRALKLQKESGLDLLIIDYLQLLSGGGRENRQQEVSKISRSLKMLARELNIPIIALSQLSRSVEQREDKRPMLSDLRESGSIEQDEP